MPRLNELDRRVLDALTGRAKLDALLAGRGYPTVRAIAQELDVAPEEVSRCLGGMTEQRRGTMGRIRDGMAALAGITREDVDSLLGGPLGEAA